jgi:hypothetical protein
MDKRERARLAEKLDLSVSDLEPLDAVELAHIRERFKIAFPDKDPDEIIPPAGPITDFRNVHFQNALVLEKYCFSLLTRFEDAQFSGPAVFKGLRISKRHTSKVAPISKRRSSSVFQISQMGLSKREQRSMGPRSKARCPSSSTGR